MIKKPRHKRVKFYHVPSAGTSRIRHSAFIAANGKVSVRNSFVTVSSPQPHLLAEVVHDTPSLSINDYEVDPPGPLPLDDNISVGRRRTPGVSTYRFSLLIIVALKLEAPYRMNHC